MADSYILRTDQSGMDTLSQDYEDAMNSQYGSYVSKPTKDWWHDMTTLLFGDKYYENQMKDYIQQVRGLELQDKSYSRMIQSLRDAGINPYYMFSSGGNSGVSAFNPENSSIPGSQRSGKSALGSGLPFLVGTLLSALINAHKGPSSVTNVTKVYQPKK